MIKIVKPEEILKPENLKAPLRPWELIIFHHTATDAEIGLHYGQTIDTMHRVERGWPNGMGYHFIISPDGTLEIGDRWMNQLEGSHCPGMNKIGIGVAFVGNFNLQHQIPSIEQIETWNRLRAMLQPRPIRPHCAFRQTDCPGAFFTEDIRTWFGMIDVFKKADA